MTTKAGGVQPSRAEIYIDTRIKKDGSIVTEKAAATIVELKKHIGETENLDNSQLTQDSTNWKNDTYSKLKRYPMLQMFLLASVNTQQETLIHYIVKVH
ncbi:hypothetical protein P8452_37878 [Trifolium repens]|nr:hypothetical protein P8452_37878 [Trifolium repens]